MGIGFLLVQFLSAQELLINSQPRKWMRSALIYLPIALRALKVLPTANLILSPEIQHQAIDLSGITDSHLVFWNNCDPSIVDENREVWLGSLPRSSGHFI